MTLSIIVPTRGRRRQLLRFLDSLAEHTADPGRLEVLLVVDEDDGEVRDIQREGLALRPIVVPPGLPMGSLNMHGCRAATGDAMMLCNDDVIVRTPGWDRRVEGVFRSFPDGIVLAHVDDGTFHERLCVFPFVTRQFVELAGGICPEGHRRYFIDDHIYNVFSLLALLGERRIQYLPDVLFEHLNYRGEAGGRVYVPDPEIHEQDAETFRAGFPARKALAVQLKERIRAHRGGGDADVWLRRLDRALDPTAMRDPAHVRYAADSRPLRGDDTRLTIGVVTANLRSSHARRCLTHLKRYTRNFELVILDNGGRADFNHAREINRLIRTAATDYLVVMDDDVFVEPGWADALLACIDARVGVVTPLHYDAYGALSYAGVLMRGDGSGRHRHDLVKPARAVPIMTLCSAVMLIDLPKCGHLRVDENYSKYFLDIDYGLSVWEAGYRVMCTPDASVTHLAGATLEHDSREAYALYARQEQYFVRKWMATGRYDALGSGVWARVPELERHRHADPVDDQLEIVETHRGYRIVRDGASWIGISEGYRAFTRRRLEGRFYRRLVVASTLEEARRALDRMTYPRLLLHARIAVDRVRGMRQQVQVRARRLGHRMLGTLGFPAQRLAGKCARLAVRVVQRSGAAARMRLASGRPK